MAIVGLVIMGLVESMCDIRAALERAPDVMEVQPTEDVARLAAVLETGAGKVEATMSRMLTWEGVLSVDLAYVSYEDDLEDGGITCPPRKPRKMCTASGESTVTA